MFHAMFHLCFISSGNCFMLCFMQCFILRGNCFILTKFSFIFLVVSSQRRTVCLKNLGRGKNFSVLGGRKGEKGKGEEKKSGLSKDCCFHSYCSAARIMTSQNVLELLTNLCCFDFAPFSN